MNKIIEKVDLIAARPGQRIAIAKGLDNFYHKYPWTPIILPTRYGKSDVIRLLAMLGWSMGHVAFNVIISPNQLLRNQIFNGQKFKAMEQRYRTRIPGVRYKIISGYKDVMNMVNNGEMMVSMTIQLAKQMEFVLLDLIQHFQYEQGLPVAFFIDETHLMSENNTWGGLATKLQKAGGLIIPLTATPFRTDGENIPGLKTNLLNEERVTYKTYQKTDVRNKLKYFQWEAAKQVSILDLEWVKKYGVYVKFSEAWDENILCKVNHSTFDHELTKEQRAGINGGYQAKDLLLSSLSESEIRKHGILQKITKDSQAIIKGSTMLLDRLNQSQSIYPEIAGLVFCGNDTQESPTSDHHAKQIRKTIARLAPEKEVLIATSSEDNEGLKNIQEFTDGKGDILIVKLMAGAGLDIPRAKVELDLSSVRTPNSFVQRTNRITTPLKDIYIAHYISPADCLARILFSAFIADEGGEHVSVVDRDLIESGEIEVDEIAKPIFHVNQAFEGMTKDTLGASISSESAILVNEIAEAFPIIRTAYTDPQIADKLNVLPVEFKEGASRARNIGLEIDGLCDDCSNIANEIIGKMLAKKRLYKGHPRYNQQYPKIAEKIFGEAKRHAGVGLKVELRKIDNLQALKMMKQYLGRLYEETR